MFGDEGNWGCAEFELKYQIPYVGREKFTVVGDSLEEEVVDDIWQGYQAINLKYIRYGRAGL